MKKLSALFIIFATLTLAAHEARADESSWSRLAQLLLEDPSRARPTDRRASQVASSINRALQRLLPESRASAMGRRAVENQIKFRGSASEASWFVGPNGDVAVVSAVTEGKSRVRVQYEFHDGFERATHLSAWRNIVIAGRKFGANLVRDRQGGFVFRLIGENATPIHEYTIETNGKIGMTARWTETNATGGPLIRSVTPTRDEVTHSGFQIAPQRRIQVLYSKQRAPRAPRK